MSLNSGAVGKPHIEVNLRKMACSIVGVFAWVFPVGRTDNNRRPSLEEKYIGCPSPYPRKEIE